MEHSGNGGRHRYCEYAVRKLEKLLSHKKGTESNNWRESLSFRAFMSYPGLLQCHVTSKMRVSLGLILSMNFNTQTAAATSSSIPGKLRKGHKPLHCLTPHHSGMNQNTEPAAPRSLAPTWKRLASCARSHGTSGWPALGSDARTGILTPSLERPSLSRLCPQPLDQAHPEPAQHLKKPTGEAELEPTTLNPRRNPTQVPNEQKIWTPHLRSQL